jgi:hypothetical protein
LSRAAIAIIAGEMSAPMTRSRAAGKCLRQAADPASEIEHGSLGNGLLQLRELAEQGAISRSPVFMNSWSCQRRPVLSGLDSTAQSGSACA